MTSESQWVARHPVFIQIIFERKLLWEVEFRLVGIRKIFCTWQFSYRAFYG